MTVCCGRNSFRAQIAGMSLDHLTMPLSTIERYVPRACNAHIPLLEGNTMTVSLPFDHRLEVQKVKASSTAAPAAAAAGAPSNSLASYGATFGAGQTGTGVGARTLVTPTVLRCTLRSSPDSRALKLAPPRRRRQCRRLSCLLRSRCPFLSSQRICEYLGAILATGVSLGYR